MKCIFLKYIKFIIKKNNQLLKLSFTDINFLQNRLKMS